MQQRVDRIPFESIVGWDVTGNGNLAQMLQEPTLMGAYEGAGVTVLGRGVRIPANSNDFWGASAAGGFPAGYAYLTSSNTDCTRAPRRPTDATTAPATSCATRRASMASSVINSSQGGGAIWAHGWNHNLEVSNTRVRANHGTLTGGITIGNGEFPDPFIVGGDNPPPPGHPDTANNNTTGLQVGYAFNRNVKVHHNMVNGNASVGDALYSGTPSAAGGISLTAGSDGYTVDHNWVCGNLSSGDAGGVAHSGFINNGTIKNNWILFNQSQSPTIPTNGGGLAILGASPDRTLPNGLECGNTAADLDCPPGLPEGTGRNLLIDGNLIMGNSAESGSGGGLRLQMVNGLDVAAFPRTPSLWNDVTVINNIITNNVAGWDGGGISMQDALAGAADQQHGEFQRHDGFGGCVVQHPRRTAGGRSAAGLHAATRPVAAAGPELQQPGHHVDQPAGGSCGNAAHAEPGCGLARCDGHLPDWLRLLRGEWNHVDE